MKWWYLCCGESQEYAIVFARSKVEDFEKLQKKRKIDNSNIRHWTIEELKSDSYGGVLYFS